MSSGKTAAEAVKDPLAEKLLGSDYYKKLSGFTKDEWARSREKQKTKERNAFTALYSDYLAPLVLAKKPIIVVGGLKTTLAALSVDRFTKEVNGICNSVEDTSEIVNSLTKAYDSSIKVPRNPNSEKLATLLDKVCSYLSDLLDRALIEIGHESIDGKKLLSKENYDKVRKGQEACKNLKDKLSQIKSELKSEPKPEIPPKDDGADEPVSKTPTKTPSSAGAGEAAAAASTSPEDDGADEPVSKTPSSAGTGKAAAAASTPPKYDALAAAPGELTDEDKRKTLGDLAKAAAEALREKGEPRERNEINDSLAKKLLGEYYDKLPKMNEAGTETGNKTEVEEVEKRWKSIIAQLDANEQKGIEGFEGLKGTIKTLLDFTFEQKNDLTRKIYELSDALRLRLGKEDSEPLEDREVSEICNNIEATSKIVDLLTEAYDSSIEVPGNSVSEQLKDSLYTMYDLLNVLLSKAMAEIGYASIVKQEALDSTNYHKVQTGCDTRTQLDNKFDQIDPLPKTTADESATDADTEGSETDEKKN